MPFSDECGGVAGGLQGDRQSGRAGGKGARVERYKIVERLAQRPLRSAERIGENCGLT
jgi:hypothetical protein